MNSMINVGTSKEAVQEVGTTILAIINALCDENTKVAALHALTQAVSVENTHISHSKFNNVEKQEYAAPEFAPDNLIEPDDLDVGEDF